MRTARLKRSVARLRGPDWVVTSSGAPYSGLWYTWGVVLVAFVVSLWGVPGGPPRDFVPDAD